MGLGRPTGTRNTLLLSRVSAYGGSSPGSVVSAGTTTFFGIDPASGPQSTALAAEVYIHPINGRSPRLRSAEVRLVSNSLSGSVTVQVWDQGGGVALAQVTVAAGTTGNIPVPTTGVAMAGRSVCWRIVAAAGTGTVQVNSLAMELEG